MSAARIGDFHEANVVNLRPRGIHSYSWWWVLCCVLRVSGGRRPIDCRMTKHSQHCLQHKEEKHTNGNEIKSCIQIWRNQKREWEASTSIATTLMAQGARFSHVKTSQTSPQQMHQKDFLPLHMPCAKVYSGPLYCYINYMVRPVEDSCHIVAESCEKQQRWRTKMLVSSSIWQVNVPP